MSSARKQGVACDLGTWPPSALSLCAALVSRTTPWKPPPRAKVLIALRPGCGWCATLLWQFYVMEAKASLCLRCASMHGVVGDAFSNSRLRPLHLSRHSRAWGLDEVGNCLLGSLWDLEVQGDSSGIVGL